LDIGCSGGPLLKLLLSQGYSQVLGIDISRKAIQLCKERDLKNVYLMDGVKSEFDSEKFDLIIASDVLEHTKDDKKAIKEWKRILKKGGVIICFVPALRFLWSDHDDRSGHYRRYTKRSLEFLFEINNFKIIRSSYWNIILFLPILFFRFLLNFPLMRKFSVNQLKESHYLLNLLLTQLLRIENALLSIGINYPLGVSVFVIAQKPEKV
jgi:SAM-dependent methyltransferase